MYGMPDRVRFAPRLAHELFLVLIYDDLGLHVTVRNPIDECNIAKIRDEFYVNSVIYRETKAYFPRDRYTNHLLFVPETMWDYWITEGLDIVCSEIDTSQLITSTAIPNSEK